MIPTQNQLVLPLLAAIHDAGGTMRAKDAADAIAETLELGSDERQVCSVTPRGKRFNVFDRTIRWTQQLAKLRGLTENVSDGLWRLTEKATDPLENIRPGISIVVYENDLGVVLWSTAEASEQRIDDNSVNCVVCSPPYELTRGKEYDEGRSESEHIKWLAARVESWKRILTDDGSVFLNLGDCWMPGEPTLSLYQPRLLLELCDRLGYRLCQTITWEQPSRLPSPAEWVTIRRVRLNNSCESIYWLSKTAHPKANNRNVLTEYSESMRKTLAKGTNAGKRPSGHVVSEDAFQADNGGAIHHNLIVAANTASNSAYLNRCRQAGIKPHPARFPEAIPEFAIKLTTEENDLVVDPFGGSCTVAEVCTRLRRRFITGDRSRHYLDGGLLRFNPPASDLACAG